MSRPRSARSNAPAAGRAGRPGVYVQAPKSDIYVVMLSIALGAMFLGTLLLVMLFSKYDFKTKPASLPNDSPASRIASLETSRIPGTVLL